MLLRIVVLLFLCMSVVMCATIGHYQAQASVEEEEEAPASTDGAAAAVGAAKEDEAATDAKIGDSPAAEETVAKTLSDDKLPVDNPAAVKPEVNVLAADRAAVEEPGTDSDGPERDATAMEALAEEAATQELPSSEEEGNEIRPVKTHQSVDRPLATEDSSSWSLNSIRNSFQTMHGYFDSLVELVGGHNGVCHYRCKYGEVPQSRPGYQHQEPNGCSSSLLGLQLDLGIPAMTKCCNELDVCYDTCGTNKYECDTKFQSCLHGICSDLKRSLGFVSKVQACESMADGLFNTVWTLGCRPYMNSQRAACVCNGEERDEL